jgi:hypothetical protein
MIVRSLALAALIAAGVPHARANTVDCGGNSYSYAEIREASSAKGRRGPIVALPDSLCADLIERRRRPPPALDIVIDPRSQAPMPSDDGPTPAWK